MVRWSVDGGGGLPSDKWMVQQPRFNSGELLLLFLRSRKVPSTKNLALGSTAFSADAPLCRSLGLALRYLSYFQWLKVAEAGEIAKNSE